MSESLAEEIAFSPQCDLTLIASDGTRFRVNKAVLKETSSVFADMLSIPQPVGSAENPEVTVSENS